MRDTRRPGIGRTVRRAAATVVAVLLITSCDAAVNRPDPSTPSGSSVPATATSVTITPVTPDGFSSGPGVTDTEITLGLLIDADRDRGFSAGVQLWQQAVNTSGGLCGRTVRLVASGLGGVPADPVAAYDAIGRTSLGLITLPAPDEAAALNSRISSDQLPALTSSGTSTQLGPTRPIVIAATEDILAINALGYVEQAGQLADGATVGVLTDGSADADNGLRGANWWAGERGVGLDVREAADDPDIGDWGGATVVLALTDAATTGRLAGQTSADITVLTTIDGYDPAVWDAAALAAAAAGRVLISGAAPAFGSDYPAALSVATQFTATGQQDPGPRLFDGYGTGVNWGRLLTEACDNRTLTRQAVQLAATAVGAASVDSLFGPTDPAEPVSSGLPATRVSAMAAADPAAASGVRPLTWLQAAAGIGDYLP